MGIDQGDGGIRLAELVDPGQPATRHQLALLWLWTGSSPTSLNHG